MTTLEIDTLYNIPIYLPLRDYREVDGKHIVDLGAGDTFKRLILDHTSFEVLKNFLYPHSISMVATEFGLMNEEILHFCTQLFEEGLLVRYQNIPEEYERFDRHLHYYSLNGMDSIKVQDFLKTISITFLGVGGIGNWIALNLVGLGIKKIRLVDPDIIEESNLTRQVLFSEKDVGKFKVDIAKEQLIGRNRNLLVESIKEDINENGSVTYCL